MASLLGQKIEPNYRGILNTETLNNPISASLQKITDGQNNFSALSLSTGQVGIAGSVQYDWVSTPTGVASKTTMWFDATGRMSWRPGTGAASFVRTFDATGITANRVYTLPNSSMSLIGTNAAIDTTLRAIVGGGTSPLQLSTTQGAFAFTSDAGLYISRGSTFEVVQYYGNSLNTIASASTFRANTHDFLVGNNGIIHGMRLSSLGNLSIGNGTTAVTARLHVRGDGTNPIARFESSTGTYFTSISQFAFGTIFAMNGFSITENTASLIFSSTNTGTGAIGTLPIYDFTANNDLSTSLTSSFFRVKRTFSASAGSANFRPFAVDYTINNSGAQTGTATGIFLNATETALNGMGHNLMDLGTGGASYVSRFIVSRTGGISLNNSNVNFTANANGVLALFDNTFVNFNRLCFGGTSNAFPALVRQGNTLEVRTADGASYAQMHAGSYAMAGYLFASLSLRFLIDQDLRGTNFYGNVGLKSSTNANHASAILDIESTTKGVLFPRMTTTQVNDITTATDGLVVYNTTIGHLCVRAAGVWHKLSQSTM
jgi:hypothetical protein